MSPGRRTVLRGLAGLAAFGLAGCSGGGYRGQQRSLTITAGEPGGFYLKFAQTLAAWINEEEPRLRCAWRTSPASVTNAQRVGSGEAELGLMQADVATAAIRGEGDDFPSPLPLVALGRPYEDYLQLVVRANEGLTAPSGLAGRPVSVGAPGSGASFTGQRILPPPDSGKQFEHRSLKDAAEALRTHRIDGFLWSGGVPTPEVVDLVRATPIDLIGLDDTVLSALLGKYGQVYEAVRIPAGAYLGVRERDTIGVANLLACRADLPGDVVAAVVRVLVNHAGDLVPPTALGTQFLEPRTLIGTGQVPLHPAAADTYRGLHG